MPGIKIEYKSGGGFEVDAATEAGVAALAQVALAILWPKSDSAAQVRTEIAELLPS